MKIARNTFSQALTLLEVLIAVAVVGMLIALALPAIVAVREASSRASCANRLRQIGLAIHAYVENHGLFPRGSFTLVGGPDGLGGPWDVLVQVLPHLEQDQTYNALNLRLRNRDVANKTIASSSLSFYLCPSDFAPVSMGYAGLGAASYHKSLGSGRYPDGADVPVTPRGRKYDGIFAPGLIAPRSVVDGLSHTAAMAEMIHGGERQSFGLSADRVATTGVTYVFNLKPPTQESIIRTCNGSGLAGTHFTARPSGKPWVDLLGYTHLSPPGQASCFDGGASDVFSPITASSRHRGGVNLLFGDGHARFISNDVNEDVWNASGSRNGQEQTAFDL